MTDEQTQQDDVKAEEVTAVDSEEQTTSIDEQNATDNSQALADAQQEIADLKDQMLRLQADTQNIRRRAELDVEKAHKFGLEKFASEMVNVVDNLERGLAAVPEEEATKAIRDGVEMTMNGLISALERFQVIAVDPEGETFNPELHQAMSMVENAEVAPNTVLAVMQKGYTLHGRLLRPAMVMVSKGASKIDEQA